LKRVIARAWGALSMISCAEPITSPTSSESDAKATIAFVGDILLDGAPGRLWARGEDPFAGVSSLPARADYVVGNLESPIATTGAKVSKVFTFRAQPATVVPLRAHIDAVSVANNHSGDYGPEALLETFDVLRNAKLPFFGGGPTQTQAHAPLLANVRGITVALLGYDEFHPRWFEAVGDTPGVAWSEEEHVVRDIRTARAKGADVILPFMHWGWENEAEPYHRQKALARTMLDAGAHAVIGAHPHVTQGVDVYDEKPIVYSLGNFLFELIDYPSNAIGWVLFLVVNKRGVESWEVHTVHLDTNGLPSPTSGVH
jgi:poly-gamma-glutamate capsule biosynthesis protein CapA/YwtB (metallophosphatase superfamily)